MNPGSPGQNGSCWKCWLDLAPAKNVPPGAFDAAQAITVDRQHEGWQSISGGPPQLPFDSLKPLLNLDIARRERKDALQVEARGCPLPGPFARLGLVPVPRPDVGLPHEEQLRALRSQLLPGCGPLDRRERLNDAGLIQSAALKPLTMFWKACRIFCGFW